MSKLLFLENDPGYVRFGCPACGGRHRIQVGDGMEPRWTWNGDSDKPTFNPSVKCERLMGKDRTMNRCHFFVREGRIEYCSDSTHELAGQTVDMRDMETTHAD